LRISAVIGMSSSSASQTSGERRCSGSERLARQAVLADERRRLGRRRRLCARRSPRRARQAVGLAAADDPLEQRACSSRDVERRVAAPTRRAGCASRSRSRCVTPRAAGT
jgi:hypothetical protein